MPRICRFSCTSCDFACSLPCIASKYRPSVHNFGEVAIRRPNRAPPAATKDGPRTNDEIRNAQVQLIDQEGLNHGTVETVADFIIGARPRSEEHTSELQSR